MTEWTSFLLLLNSFPRKLGLGCWLELAEDCTCVCVTSWCQLHDVIQVGLMSDYHKTNSWTIDAFKVFVQQYVCEGYWESSILLHQIKLFMFVHCARLQVHGTLIFSLKWINKMHMMCGQEYTSSTLSMAFILSSLHKSQPWRRWSG